MPDGQQTVTPVVKQCLTRPTEQVLAQGTNTLGVPELYRAVTSASDMA